MRLSFQKKILIALISLPIVALAAFCLLALTTFVTDKTLNVNEGGIIALEQRSLLLSEKIKDLRGFIKSWKKESSSFVQLSKVLSIIQVWEKDSNGNLNLSGSLPISSNYKNDLLYISSKLGALPPSAKNMFFFVREKRLFGILNTKENITLVDWSHYFSKITRKTDYRDTLLIDTKKSILLSTDTNFLRKKIDDVFPGILEKISEINNNQSSFEYLDINNVKMLISYKYLPSTNLIMFLSVDKWTTLRASLIFIIKALALIIFLAVLSYGIAHFVSHKMTKDIKALEEKMNLISDGNFDVKITTSSKDEIGRLADKFRWMISRLKYLILKREEHVHLEQDLEVAKTVQDMFFPQESSTGIAMGIYGKTEMATKCGGDWWYYFQTETNIYMIVGDATGHGVPAALMTSVVRATLSSLMINDVCSVSDILFAMNKSIFEAAKGRIHMTMFACTVDKTTGELTYSNASHDPPFIIKPTENNKNFWDNFTPLIEFNGPRLGESLISHYKEETIQLNPSDKLLLYTDGVYELSDENNTNLDERGFYKKVLSNIQKSKTVDYGVNNLLAELKRFHKHKIYPDDWSLLLYYHQQDTERSKASTL